MLRLIHISDIHFWRYSFNPFRMFSKRLVGMGSLLVRRARKFRLERIAQVVEYVLALRPDHILITGDLTTTALDSEFLDARHGLSPWLDDHGRVTVIPGNHDRYTLGAHRNRRFEHYFGGFAPSLEYPWLRMLDHETAVLGLDPTRAGLSARGRLPESQLSAARKLWIDSRERVRRMIIACHYPLDAPPVHRRDLAGKPMANAPEVARWLSTIGHHLYCCGHVHAAWAFVPEAIPGQICVNAGAPLLRDHTGHRPPGFLEILLSGGDVKVTHHAWRGDDWEAIPLHDAQAFFPIDGNRGS